MRLPRSRTWMIPAGSAAICGVVGAASLAANAPALTAVCVWFVWSGWRDAARAVRQDVAREARSDAWATLSRHTTGCRACDAQPCPEGARLLASWEATVALYLETLR